MRRRSLLTASTSSGGNLITFTIDDTEYQAEEGMTWGGWVDSEYNVNGKFEIDPSDNSIGYNEYESMFAGWVGNDAGYVFVSDIIQEGCDYMLVQ